MRTGITIRWIANVNPCDTTISSDLLIAGVIQRLGSYSRTIPNTKSPLVPGIEMNSMLCPPVCVIIPSQLDLVQVQMSINCIWNHLSPCELAHHTSGIVVLNYLVTYERDLCPPQVRWNQRTAAGYSQMMCTILRQEEQEGRPKSPSSAEAAMQVYATMPNLN
ncbi:hypothetical protein M9H77_31808 [Catharanthus roseus]|uniref:Uncharacterized protein n=1 Tax=Catharanthus roseus TaxID=4058 RepID=A0ACC0A222_CATRO|nr:hypothetical protein M9H77_31808 [Catharanthus roseus]